VEDPQLMADGYHRDMNVFADDITIEDDMSVLVRYDNGANMTYHLTAYSVSPRDPYLLQPLAPSTFPSMPITSSDDSGR